jgi:hypothetical protein
MNNKKYSTSSRISDAGINPTTLSGKHASKPRIAASAMFAAIVIPESVFPTPYVHHKALIQ